MSKAPLCINTDAYKASEGHTPRGRGSWAFCPRAKYNTNNYLDYVLFSPSLTYSDAKKWLKKQGVSGEWVACT